MLTLIDSEGTPLDVVLVTAGTRAGLPSATFEVDAKTWERVESEGLLHVDPARSRGASRPFDDVKPVQIDAVLDPVAAIDGADDLARRLIAASDTDPLRSTEAWWTLSATQEVDLPSELHGRGTLHEGVAFEHPSWLQDSGGSVGLEEAWKRALEETDVHDGPEPMLTLIREVFDEHGWVIERPREEATVLHAPVEASPQQFDLYVRTDEPRHIVTAYAVLATNVDADRIPLVHELAARLNGAVALGSYEVNADDGVLSFKSAIDVTGDELSTALVRQLIGAVLTGGERALQAYLDVVSGAASPADAALQASTR
jgi:hypothetical protein